MTTMLHLVFFILLSTLEKYDGQIYSYSYIDISDNGAQFQPSNDIELIQQVFSESFVSCGTCKSMVFIVRVYIFFVLRGKFDSSQYTRCRLDRYYLNLSEKYRIQSRPKNIREKRKPIYIPKSNLI